MRAARRWWSRVTPAQVFLFLAGAFALYLGRDHLPTDPDGWKEWIDVVAYACVALATAGTLVHGREERLRMRPAPAERRDREEGSVGAEVLAAVAIGLAVYVLVTSLPGCASGPQLVTTTPVISLSVTFDAHDGGTMSRCEVWVDGVGQDSKPTTTGNEVDAEVDAAVDTSVSAVP